MFQRILAIVAATLLLAACETASEVGGDSVCIIICCGRKDRS